MTSRPRHPFTLSFSLFALAAFFVACNGDDPAPTGGSVTINAPAIVSPTSGSQVDGQPTLTVSNATVSDGSTPTYHFQVASDSGFSNIAAQAEGIAQGGGGQTSWQVPNALSPGQYFWRARAQAGGTSGPFSATAEITVTGLGPAPGNVVLFDPLTNGTTLAVTRNGGQFTDRGWRVTSNRDFLRYEVPAISNGFVEWQNTGLTPRGINADSHMLFGMWDPTAGAYRANPFRVHVQKLWDRPHNPPFVRLRWIANGELHDGGFNFTDWDPGHVYTWRLEWGPESGANTARLFLEGQVIIQLRYGRTYLPHTHFIELGVAERNESVIDAIYSNFRVGTR